MTNAMNNAAAVAESHVNVGTHAAGTLEKTGGRTMETIEAALLSKLDPAHVRARKQGGRDVSYVEGWHAIAEMNRIMGHLSWDRETTIIREVCRYTRPQTDREGNPTGKENHVVGYEAKVRITVYPLGVDEAVVREGTGYGQGIDKDLYAAIESAGKEAETDAMKRALMTFGNPFGLALYDKEKKEVGVTPPKVAAKPEQKKQTPKQQATVLERCTSALAAVKAAASEPALRKLTDSRNYQNLLVDLRDMEERSILMNAVTAKYQHFLSVVSA